MPVIYKEKVEYAYTDPGVKAHTLSWAEYQALPTAQKMNGDLYFIPNKQPEGNPSRIWAKLGTEPLDTQAEDVSGAVNELNSSLTNIEGMLPTTATNSGWRIISFPNIKMRILSSAQSITYPANTGSKNFDFTFPSNSFETVYSFQVNASVNGRTDTEVRYVRGSANGCQAYIACGATANTSGTVYITAIGRYS